MPMTQITDHEDQAQARLPEQFKGKVLTIAMVRSLAAETQDIEDSAFPMFSLLDIATMIGAQLDGIGDILTEPRAGQNDADYRVALLAKGARITASGTPEQVIERFIALTGSTPPVDFLEDFPAGYCIYGDGSQFDNLLASMEGATGVGIYIGLLDLLELIEDVAPYDLTGSTYDGDDLEITGGAHAGETFVVGTSEDGLFLLEDGDTFYVTYDSSGR